MRYVILLFGLFCTSELVMEFTRHADLFNDINSLRIDSTMVGLLVLALASFVISYKYKES